MSRRLLIRCSVLAIVVATSAFLIEALFEARDFARLMPGQMFAQVGKASIRYRLTGAGHPGTVVVFLTGVNGTVEQLSALQDAVSDTAAALTYDRAGYGFSRGSSAHNAVQQADELIGLLHALGIERPVLLVAFSSSGELARVFAGRYPQKIAGMYLIEPWMPELELLIPERYSPRRFYARLALENIFKSSLGLIRLGQRMRDWRGPASQFDQRVEAILARRSHNWAIAAEWYERPETSRQTLAARIPDGLTLEVVSTQHQFPGDDAASEAVEKMYADLVGHSRRGHLFKFGHVDHSQLIHPSPVFDSMVARIKALSQQTMP